MIVIATNNGASFLKESLDNLSILNVNIPISIIDTGSNDTDSINFLTRVKSEYKKLKIDVFNTPYSGFDTGAYIYAMNNITAERYYFIHDSLIIKRSDFFSKIDNLLDNGVVVSLLDFSPNSYDNIDQINFCNDNFGSKDYDIGIFGPIFSILKKDVDNIIGNLKNYPTNKNQQMAMERGWSVLFKNKNIKIISLFGTLDINKIIYNEYSYFKKYLPHRNYNI